VKKLSKKARAKHQQAAVAELAHMVRRLEILGDGIDLSCSWFPRDFDFTNGQVAVMLGIAARQIREALLAFEDCAEEGVEVPT